MPCNATEQEHCQPLSSLSLRLADSILSQPATAFKQLPKGSIEAGCSSSGGPGLRFNTTQLGSLADPLPEEEVSKAGEARSWSIESRCVLPAWRQRRAA